MSLSSGINDLIDYSELIIDKKLLNFFGSKEYEFNTCYGESMELFARILFYCFSLALNFYFNASKFEL